MPEQALLPLVIERRKRHLMATLHTGCVPAELEATVGMAAFSELVVRSCCSRELDAEPTNYGEQLLVDIAWNGVRLRSGYL